MDILNTQKQLTLNRNQLNAIYYNEFAEGNEKTCNSIKRGKEDTVKNLDKGQMKKDGPSRDTIVSTSNLAKSGVVNNNKKINFGS